MPSLRERLGAVVEESQPQLIRVARRALGTTDGADDVVNDALLTILEADAVAPVQIDDLLAWLVVTVRRLGWQRRARRKTFLAHHRQYNDDTDSAPSENECVRSPIAFDQLRMAVHELTAERKSVINAIYWQGQSMTVIARGRGVRRQNIQNLHRAALAELNRSLGGNGRPPTGTTSRPFYSIPVRGWVRSVVGGFGAPYWTCGICRAVWPLDRRWCRHP